MRTIGTGTFGRVYLALLSNPPGDKRPRAIKVLRKDQLIKMRQIEHIKSEKNILMEINHPFIVSM